VDVHRLPLLLPGLTALLAAGCPQPGSSSTGTGSVPTPDAGASCMESAVQACPCSGTEGQQVCTAGAWSDCDCSTGDGDGTPQLDAGEDLGRLKCKAGYYVGTFEGDWKPGIGDFPPLGTLIEVTITASDEPGKPGLALTLEEQLIGEDSEFPTYTVKNGCIVGTANSGGDQNHPFIGTITGDLHCDTGKFEGHLDGYYELFGLKDISEWFFAGSMDATFNIGTTSLEMGTWDLREKQSTAPDGPGGKAMWQATWQSETGPELPEECLKLLQMNADAGTPVADGGI
jgi:hypothetical protein